MFIYFAFFLICILLFHFNIDVVQHCNTRSIDSEPITEIYRHSNLLLDEGFLGVQEPTEFFMNAPLLWRKYLFMIYIYVYLFCFFFICILLFHFNIDVVQHCNTRSIDSEPITEIYRHSNLLLDEGFLGVQEPTEVFMNAPLLSNTFVYDFFLYSSTMTESFVITPISFSSEVWNILLFFFEALPIKVSMSHSLDLTVGDIRYICLIGFIISFSLEFTVRSAVLPIVLFYILFPNPVAR
eukprot:gene12412-8518_t